MPGFLGTERQFAARYGKPILASRDAKSSSREQEAGLWAPCAPFAVAQVDLLGFTNGALLPDRPGVLAMEALHRQVLPFLLRRMKEDVLQDLPPKIIQDYYCTLSPLQVTTAPGCSGMSCLFYRSSPVTHTIEMRVLAPDSVSVQLSGRQIVSLAECEYFPQETRNLAQA